MPIQESFNNRVDELCEMIKLESNAYKKLELETRLDEIKYFYIKLHTEGLLG